MATHVLACQDDEAVKVFHHSIKATDEWMIKVDIVPEVRQAIKQTLISCKEGRRIPIPKSDWQGFVEAIHSQE